MFISLSKEEQSDGPELDAMSVQAFRWSSVVNPECSRMVEVSGCHSETTAIHSMSISLEAGEAHDRVSMSHPMNFQDVVMIIACAGYSWCAAFEKGFV